MRKILMVDADSEIKPILRLAKRAEASQVLFKKR